jgi:hypothetical protein
MKGEAFVKMPRAVLESSGWRSLGINARRFVDFLMIENMNKWGKENGHLLAPRRQLEEAGIGARHVSAAIGEAETCGFVDVKRGVGRRPSTYALTWLPLADGTEPSRRWMAYTDEMTSEGKHLGYPKGSHKARSGFPSEVTKQENKGIRREVPYKKASYHSGGSLKEVEGEGVQPLGAGAAVGEGERRRDDGQPVRQPCASVGPPCPYRGCGKPIGLCEHTRRAIPAAPSGTPNGSIAP